MWKPRGVSPPEKYVKEEYGRTVHLKSQRCLSNKMSLVEVLRTAGQILKISSGASHDS